MIQDLMRKHKTAFLWVILLLVIVPFVYWGGYSGLRRYRNKLDHEAFPPVAMVGNTPIPQQWFRTVLGEELNRRRQFQPDITYRDLHEDGTAMQVLNNLVNRTVLDMEADETGLTFTQDFLIEEMKKLPQFQKDGKFDPKAWNDWIDARGRHNWNADYAAMEADLRRRAALDRILAPVRVLDRDVRQMFEEQFTRLRVRYVAVAPKIEPTEEELQAFFNEHADKYQTPEKRKAAFVAISITPPKPSIVDELVSRARAGEDFAELAKQYSEGPDKDNGGDMGWRVDAPMLPEHQKTIFRLNVGEVSDAVEAFGAYYIFKVEEERTEPDKNVREVKARQIVIRPKLSEEDRAARMQEAEALLAKAKEANDLRAAALAMGREVGETDMFSEDSLQIASIPTADTWAFRSAVLALADNALSDVIEGRNNLYVAQVIGSEPPSPLPFEEVRDRVRQDFITEREASAEYREKVNALAEEIKNSAKSLTDVLRMYPNEGFTVAETDWFTVAEYRPGVGPMWRARDVFDAVGKKDVGAFGGPVQGYDGKVYFVELLGKEPPDETVWKEKWEEQEPIIRDRLLAEARQDRLEDYLRNSAVRRGLRINQAVYDEVLGLNAPEDAQHGGEPAESAPSEPSSDANNQTDAASSDAGPSEAKP